VLSTQVACNGGAGGSGFGSGRIVRVPQEVPTVQGAVSKAKSGDIVLVSPGTYHEKVLVDRPGITIRGTDRNTVIFDGEYKLQNAIEVAADGVVVENLTAHSYNGNGVFFNGAYSPNGVDKTKTYGAGNDALKGYRASYITAYNNGLYGIYAFASRGGQIDHSYVSGNADSGVYVGQCKPCNVLVTDVLAERNPVGYFGTNASEGVFVVNSVFRGNRVGVWPNTEADSKEKLSPQTNSVVAGNLIIDGGAPDSPPQAQGANGLGVLVKSGNNNVVLKNRIVGNIGAGVLITDDATFSANTNRVEANVLERNAVDLFFASVKATTAGNCFRGNTFTSSSPPQIEAAIDCAAPAATAIKTPPYSGPGAKNGPDYRKVAAPPAQPTMPNAETAPPRPAQEVVPTVDLATIQVPAG
jgi:Right handed beta helix region